MLYEVLPCLLFLVNNTIVTKNIAMKPAPKNVHFFYGSMKEFHINNISMYIITYFYTFSVVKHLEKIPLNVCNMYLICI